MTFTDVSTLCQGETLVSVQTELVCAGSSGMFDCLRTADYSEQAAGVMYLLSAISSPFVAVSVERYRLRILALSVYTIFVSPFFTFCSIFHYAFVTFVSFAHNFIISFLKSSN